MRILAVDTALGACSAALVENSRVLAHRFELMDRGHAERLAPMVEEVMAEAAIGFASLDRLAVTTGPGTFTGQRVGLAFMRGMRIALGRPLIGITTLATMAAQAKAETGCARAVSLHDARREEVYIEIDGRLPPSLMAFDDAITTLGELGSDAPVALAGTAACRACEALANGFVLSTVRQPNAQWLARLATSAPDSDAAPRPLYLRAPDAKLPTAGRTSGAPLPVTPESDLSELARIHAVGFDRPWNEGALRDLLRTPGTIGFAASGGFIIVRVAADEAEILTLAVAPDARRRGTGKALVSAAAARAHELGARAMLLEVRASNASARALYKRFGFAEVGARKAYYGQEDALILRANLPIMPLGNPRASITVAARPRGSDRDAD
jgi:tRNA threonylcarbamoyladenosine biosynthesis protein TsaB